jgi:hypothetical protein
MKKLLLLVVVLGCLADGSQPPLISIVMPKNLILF